MRPFGRRSLGQRSSSAKLGYRQAGVTAPRTIGTNRLNAMTERNGQCLCGAVSYTVSAEPLAARICWCRDCQRLAADGTANMLVPADALSVSGRLSEFTKTSASGNAVTRQFCTACGSHLFACSNTLPQFRVIRIGTLDDPSSVRPTMNIWTVSAPEWSCMDPDLMQVERQPPPPSPKVSHLT